MWEEPASYNRAQKNTSYSHKDWDSCINTSLTKPIRCHLRIYLGFKQKRMSLQCSGEHLQAGTQLDTEGENCQNCYNSQSLSCGYYRPKTIWSYLNSSHHLIFSPQLTKSQRALELPWSHTLWPLCLRLMGHGWCDLTSLFWTSMKFNWEVSIFNAISRDLWKILTLWQLCWPSLFTEGPANSRG